MFCNKHRGPAELGLAGRTVNISAEPRGSDPDPQSHHACCVGRDVNLSRSQNEGPPQASLAGVAPSHDIAGQDSFVSCRSLKEHGDYPSMAILRAPKLWFPFSSGSLHHFPFWKQQLKPTPTWVRSRLATTHTGDCVVAHILRTSVPYSVRGHHVPEHSILSSLGACIMHTWMLN